MHRRHTFSTSVPRNSVNPAVIICSSGCALMVIFIRRWRDLCSWIQIPISHSRCPDLGYQRTGPGFQVQTQHLGWNRWPATAWILAVDRSRQPAIPCSSFSDSLLALVFCLCSPHVLKTARLAWSRDMSRLVPLVSFFQFECRLHLPSAFDSLLFATHFVEKKFDGRVLESQNLPCNCWESNTVCCTPGCKIMKE